MSRRTVATLLVTLGSLASACPAAATPRSSHKGSGKRCSRAGRAEELSLGDQFPTLQTVRVLARVVAEGIVAVHPRQLRDPILGHERLPKGRTVKGEPTEATVSTLSDSVKVRFALRLPALQQAPGPAARRWPHRIDWPLFRARLSPGSAVIFPPHAGRAQRPSRLRR